MKVLFAVNNDEISNAIIKRYQKDYKEILSYKNVYYFNAILKELQKDKSYDRVVISEDLEPFANNNYDTIDKFLFEKLDNISKEIADSESNDKNNNMEIILICTDRRNKSDDMLAKIFEIGIFSAMIGQDRSIEEVCKLINKPRSKKEAKQYYKIELDSAVYQTEGEESVSETEVQNILAHYKRLGKNEDKYVDSFNNIVSQYTDTQLKIIIRYLPISVKAVLEEKSSKYQQLVAFNNRVNIKSQNQYNAKSTKKNQESGVKAQLLEKESKKSEITRPIVVPAGVNTAQVKRLIKQEKPQKQLNTNEIIKNDIEEKNTFKETEKELENIINNELEMTETKRGRGRPRKNIVITEEQNDKPKRGRGRPRKNPLEQSDEYLKEEQKDEELDLFNLTGGEEEKQSNNVIEETLDLDEELDLFNLSGEEEEKQVNNIIEEDLDEELDLFNLSDEEEEKQVNNSIEESLDINEELDLFDLEEDSNDDIENNNTEEYNQVTQIVDTLYKSNQKDNYSTMLTKDKKIVSFVGTTKNGTSFIVNNTAHMLASMGIQTAILDMTKTRNAYYIYTNSEERLMETAKKSIYKLRSGIADGIKVNKNLTVYTTVPDDNTEYTEVDAILSTLLKNYSVVLIDCDFDTPIEYFGASQEIYLVQSMDVLTIQPLTAFLRDLQSKGVLRQEKIKIIINKSVNIRSVPIKTLIGGISKYNDPSLTIMKDLFDKDKVSYCVIPFETQNYVKYLDALITCTITLNGYSKSLITALKELCGMIYPLISKPTYSPIGNKYRDDFSAQMNNTLNKMKRKYQ